MNKRIYFLSLVISALLVSPIYAQSTDVADKDLTWRASSLTDKNYSKNISTNHRLVTHGRTTMELHRGSEQTLTFTILSITGTWSDEKTAGKLAYDVRSANGVLGKVTVERKGASVTAWVDFTQSNKNGLNIELKIDTIE
jgi:hypothetical protein